MEIVLLGRSNVGKSSVIRQLTGKKIPIGRRPGLTRRIDHYKVGRMEIVDMPGFGFMSGISKTTREKKKTEIVKYIEQNRDRIILSLEVLDARSFSEIAERWDDRGQVPIDIEIFSFLQELELNPIVIVNKIDIIKKWDRNNVLDDICKRLGILPPWRQWFDVMVPISAKTGEGVPILKKLIKLKMHELGKGRLLGWLK